MLQPIVITPKVISTIQSLPEEERVTIAGAIAKEMILGDSDVSLSPVQRIIYAIKHTFFKILMSKSVSNHSQRFKYVKLFG